MFFFFIFNRSPVRFSCTSATCVLTFDLDSPLVTVIRARQTNIVIEILDRANTLVAAIVAVVFTVADLALIYALVIVASKHAVAVHASLRHFVIIELPVRFKRASQADVAVAEQTDVAVRSETKYTDDSRGKYLQTVARYAGKQLARERSHCERCRHVRVYKKLLFFYTGICIFCLLTCINNPVHSFIAALLLNAAAECSGSGVRTLIIYLLF